jgi:hypothetical protein
MIPLFLWTSRTVGKALAAERGPLRRTASTAVASLVAFSLDLLPLTYAATLLFPADRSPDLSLRGEIWVGGWLGALVLSAAVLFIKRRNAT